MIEIKYLTSPPPQYYCPYHFNCTGCGIELTSSAREVKTRPGYTAQELNELYCLRCHDRMGIPICGACRRPIEVGWYRYRVLRSDWKAYSAKI